MMSINEVAKLLGVSIDTLRRWDASGKLRAERSPGGHRHYDRDTIERFSKDFFALARVWAESVTPPELPSEVYCDTPDRFRARQNTLAILLDRQEETRAIAPIVASMTGEIGNNSFDHNIGNWPDVTGIFFAYDLPKRIVVLADRGVGIRATLLRVRPDIKDDIEALTIAIYERISGRAPEQRGNGLKFVRKVAEKYGVGVTLQSGIAVAEIKKGTKKLSIRLADRNIRGTIAKITY
ncbi:MAG: hypothetical protein A3C93_00195 [Candidatus Lloydbacteria bacterium RIFCSPHIGHO2_02_FULL_54_17]|uniref:HTH merR-type domain-containing protein n=1 Tax=Candidatus Lloydbacteria bacterium RIFCSPHIGHO2_02_FULL_54_17 TaxID=1798664 RepID=A0A1G2DIJ4_9BACT|nr:MAG: hypothetical protein A2762_03945 [Candidatus Lloydbacteria bacterium RIFCSPHIGHO2_01_FULL_54_11]OGZ13323.1 MAG: hypothetical protein A3C93_00195 [Candidatus Lloydbacteria bacterium RIFCSPHIGHO2_02_FULL_54_17]OGZ17131.1 MAG: hypothetical protein A3H76_02995 [Candidatus Lloydbacteria bacterium RIFCSPLOWO2_02_FULL_54_12]